MLMVIPTDRRKPLRVFCLLILGIAVALTGPLTAPAAEETEAEPGIGELERRIAELEAAVEALRARPAGAAGEEIAELQRRIDLLAAELEKLRLGEAAADTPPESKYGLGPAASRVYGKKRGVSIGGYGEMLYENFDARNESGNSSGKENRLDFLRGVLYFGYKFNDRIVFNSEVEFEHSSTDRGGEVSLEFAYLDFLLSEGANVRTGLVMIPAGFLNELHEPPVFLGARRPDVERRIIPTTWRENGVGAFGDLGPFSYRAYVTAGLESEGFTAANTIRGGRQKGSKSIAEDLAFAARVDYSGVPGLLLGGFYYSGNSAQGREAPSGFATDPNGQSVVLTSPFDARVTLFDVHVEYRARGLQLRGLYTEGRIGDAKEVNDANGFNGMEAVARRFRGWYVEAGYDLLALRREETGQSLIPYIRHESLDTQEKVPGEGPFDPDPSTPGSQATPFAADPANDLRSWTYGVAYKPIFNVVVKLDYTDYRNEAATSVDQFSLAVGYLF
jgi:hypothetical protein